MPPMQFSVLGYQCEEGVKQLKEVYDKSNANLILNIDKTGHLLETIESASNESGEGSSLEEYSKEAVLEYKLTTLKSLVQSLRQAFVLMLYHFWEKQVQNWMKIAGTTGHDHGRYIKFCRTLNLDLDEYELEKLRLLANLIKHGQGRSEWGDQLWLLMPEIFLNEGTSDDPLEYLVLDADSLPLLFNAVLYSGPSRHSDFHPK